MAKRRIKINHWRRVKSEQSSVINSLTPGLIIKFRYDIKESFDEIPLCLFLWRDIKYNIIHTVNLNYLYESKVQLLFERINKVIPVMNLKNNENDDPVTRAIIPPAGPGSAKTLYDTVIKKDILPEFDSYRTYKIKKIRDLKIVEYDFIREL